MKLKLYFLSSETSQPYMSISVPYNIIFNTLLYSLGPIPWFYYYKVKIEVFWWNVKWKK